MQHEQSFADLFNAFMRDKAPNYGCRFHSFSLDGQDRDAGADYVLTDADRFAIVEFKYTQNTLVSEKYKPKRLVLCRKLESRQDMRDRHDRCHFISWAEGPEMKVMTNIYRYEICTEEVFGEACGLSLSEAKKTIRAAAGTFAQEFFDQSGRRALSLIEFQAYIAWILTETSSSTTSTLELIAHNPYSDDLALVRLDSIESAQKWVRDHVRPPPPKKEYEPSFGM